MISVSRKSKKSLRIFGVIWVLLAPLIFFIAAISTVRSEVTYHIQLIVFSVVALAGLIVGVGGLFLRSWSVVGMFILSWMSALYFLGSALIIAIMLIIPRVNVVFNHLLLLVALAIALTGVPFIVMAQSLAKLRNQVKKDEES